MDTRHCPCCGWPTDQPFQIVSRHDTSEGPMVWVRCACGRLSVEPAGAAGGTEVASGPVGETEVAGAADLAGPVGPCPGVAEPLSRGARRPRNGGRVAAMVVGGLLAAVSLINSPTPVWAACAALAVVSGLLTGAWGWLAHSLTPWASACTGMRGAVFGGAAGALLVGLLTVLGSATVVLLPASYLLAAVLFVLARPARRTPC